MLKASFRPVARVKVGEVAEGKVISIGKDNIFLDLGIRAEGMIDREEFERQGELTVKQGDPLQVLVTLIPRRHIPLHGRLRQAGRSDSRQAKDSPSLTMLREAFNARIPVEGRVKAVNKGGFEVQVMGQKAFCPISQIERNYCQNPEIHLEQDLYFSGHAIRRRRPQYRGRPQGTAAGRGTRKSSQRLGRNSQLNQVREGTVTSVHDYGAFVDIGGVEGLLHVSEISYQKIAKRQGGAASPGKNCMWPSSSSTRKQARSP